MPVRLKPYAILAEIGDKEEGGRWQGARGELAEWSGNAILAIWIVSREGDLKNRCHEIQ